MLVDRIDGGEASEEDVAWHRLLVNANKLVTSVAATKVVRRGIETLGGNGTIEDFSPLPRLYRDAIVFESWEGTHNVLCAQVLRDLGKLDAVDLAVERAGASEDLAERLRARSPIRRSGRSISADRSTSWCGRCRSRGFAEPSRRARH